MSKYTEACCKICKSSRVSPLYRSQRYGFSVGRCGDCGLSFVLDQIDPAQLKKMYSDKEGFKHFNDAMINEKVYNRHDMALQEIRQWLQETTNFPRLLDVGAGSGEFLNMAREFGFEIEGNEISEEAISIAEQRYDIALRPQPLEKDERTDFFDVVTMWGLIEHVVEPLSILNQAFRLLRGGGILYIYTPVWCLYDDIGLGFSRFCGWTRLLDRRITLAHLQLFSIGAMHKVLTAIGFDLLKTDIVCEYNLPVTAYLESLGIPEGIKNSLAVFLAQLIDRNLFFRNNMRVFSRKPVA